MAFVESRSGENVPVPTTAISISAKCTATAHLPDSAQDARIDQVKSNNIDKPASADRGSSLDAIGIAVFK